MAVFYSDTFDEASSTGITSHTPNVGGAYSHSALAAGTDGTVGAGTGLLTFPSSSISIAKNAATPGSADYTLTFTFQWSDTVGRLDCCARLSGSTGYYFYASFGGIFRIYLDNTGSTELASGTHTGTNGYTDYTVSISVSGSSISFTVNGTTITATNSARTSAGAVAIGGRAVNFKTASADDSTASGPATPTTATTTSVTSSGATVGASTTETSGTRYVVVTTSGTPPSLNGNGTGFVSGSYAYSSSASISGSGAFTYSASGLSASTIYYHHHVIGSGGADSGVLTSSSFTTSAGAVSSIAAISNYYRTMRST